MDAEYIKCGNASLSWHLTYTVASSPLFPFCLSLYVSLTLSVSLLNRDIRTKIWRQQLHTHLMVLGACAESNFFSKLKMKGV